MMLTKESIERFRLDVKSLGLKFPGATIAKQTKYSKGQVSAYLNGEDPSENFLKAFYEKFGESLKKVQVGKNNDPAADPLSQALPMGDLKLTVADYIKKIEEGTRKVEEHNRVLQQILTDKLGKIEEYSGLSLVYASNASLRVGALSDVALESLARLEKKPIGSLMREAGKLVNRNIAKQQKQGKLPGAHKRHTGSVE